jgi:hypothetical protein
MNINNKHVDILLSKLRKGKFNLEWAIHTHNLFSNYLTYIFFVQRNEYN